MDRKDRLAEWLFVRQGSTACGLWRCVAPYRGSKYFQSARNQRSWIAGTVPSLPIERGLRSCPTAARSKSIRSLAASRIRSQCSQSWLKATQTTPTPPGRLRFPASAQSWWITIWYNTFICTQTKLVLSLSTQGRRSCLARAFGMGFLSSFFRHKSSDKGGIATEAEIWEDLRKRPWLGCQSPWALPFFADE